MRRTMTPHRGEERRRGRRMEKKEEEEDNEKRMASGDNDRRKGKGGKEYDSFFRPSNGMGRRRDNGSIDSGTQQSNS
jgi:hypothetical protein